MESHHISVQERLRSRTKNGLTMRGLFESKQRFIKNSNKIRLLKFSVIFICLTFPLIVFGITVCSCYQEHLCINYTNNYSFYRFCSSFILFLNKIYSSLIVLLKLPVRRAIFFCFIFYIQAD